MTSLETKRLRAQLLARIAAGASTDETEERADAYAFSRWDLVEVIHLLVQEKESA